MRPTLDAELTTRRETLASAAVLRRMAVRIEALLGGLVQGPVYLPSDKALLSRDGGVCPTDGSRLAFDPDSPYEHRCDRCGARVSGRRHHRAWITRYQLWLSERTIHLALLGALLERPTYAARAAEILVLLASRYRDYPNEDNVLGPTRPFFSTYLESIWLTQLSIAATLLDAAAPAAWGRGERTRVHAMLRESADLVASFDEGWSNRQVWHATALLGAGTALGDRRRRRAGAERLARLLTAVDADGFWFEGENYHLFALRGFLLGAELARWDGRDLYQEPRLGAMYAAPLATLQPDRILPARGDAPFGVSVAQPRFAELWEIGRARTTDARLEAVLADLYGADLPADDGTSARAELSEQEQNRPAMKLHRDQLGWKCLLWMRPDDPTPAEVTLPRALLLDRQGLAVLRPGSRRVVMLETGRQGGGHAHPDRLHLSVFWDQPVLADFGTGSYVTPSLHWYRSALAHNAPSLAGRGLAGAVSACDGLGAEGEWLWCSAVMQLDGLGATVRRSTLAGPEWVLDLVSVQAPADVTIDLPLHPLGGLPPGGLAGEAVPATADAGHETGYGHLRELRAVSPGEVRCLELGGDPPLQLHGVARPDEQVFTAVAPGPPTPDLADGAPLRFLVRRATGSGRWIHVIAPASAVAGVREDGGAIVVETARGRTVVTSTAEEMRVEPDGAPPMRFGRQPVAWPDGSARLRLGAVVQIPLWKPDAAPFAAGAAHATWRLGTPHYRRSERSHDERGGMTAVVDAAAQSDALWVRVAVTKPDIVVRDPAAPEPALDNEVAEIHSDGVQLYVGRASWAGVLVLPDLDGGGVRVRAVAGTAGDAETVSGSSRRTADGYEVIVRLAVGVPLRRGERLRFTVTVNEMVPGRVRRAGQLALSGGGWVWLRGDRESPAAALEAEIV